MISTIAYNIHYGKKLGLIQEWLLTEPLRFDIICLQEFPYEEHSEFLKLFKKHSYDYRFAPSFSRRKRQYGELTLFNTKKVKLLEHRVIGLGTNILENRFRKNNGEKSSLLTMFQYKNKKFIVTNSHLFCFALNSHRINQLTKILHIVNTITKSKEFPTVILGDFNYTSIIRQKKLIDFMKSYSLDNAYKTHTHRLFFLKQQLDYVFYNNCSITDIVIDKIKYSDHYPVHFKIKFKD